MQERPAGTSTMVLLALAGLVVGAVFGLPVAILAGPAVGAVVLGIVALVTALVVRVAAGAVVLRLLDGHPPALGDVGPARLVNLVESVAVAVGVPQPTLLVVSDPAPNALVTGIDARRASLVVTSGLFDRLDRLALEAVVAQQLSIIRTGDTHRRDVAVVVLGLAAQVVPALRPLADRACALAPGRDVAACGITRYPPGLLAALEAATAGPEVGSSAVLAPLWFVPPRSTTDLALRLETMRELL